jgi:hypothetical protein
MMLHLDVDLLAVQGAAEQVLTEFPVAPYGVGPALVNDVVAALGRDDRKGVMLAVHHHDPLGRHGALVPAQLPVDAGGPVTVAAHHGGRHGQDNDRILVRQIRRVEAVGVFLPDHVRADVAGDVARVRHQRRQETEVVGYAADDEAVQRRTHAGDGFRAIRAPGDQLGDHGIVEHRDLASA